ncbi:MAG: uncharacterized protein JWN25_1250 [Verrucomicrobiales bacterium]|nr:uncharacterized protein [Verrucomicrobiales bacterium]
MRSLKAFVLSLLVLSVSAFSSQAGQVQRLFYPSSIAGFAFTNDPAFPGNFDPTEFDIAAIDLTFMSKGLEYNEAISQNFGTFVRGYIEAPQSGVYTFFISSDDESELWLSTDANEVNKKLIASNNGAVGFRSFTGKPAQRSAKITLVKGTKYYFEHYFHQGGGGEHFSVAWTLPDGTFQVIPASALNLYKQIYTIGANGQKVSTTYNGPTIINIFNSGNLPATTTAIEHTNVVLTVNVSGAQQISYQWHSIVGTTDTTLTGQTLSSLTLTNVPTSLSGTKYYVVISNSVNTITSAQTTMSITPETVKPTVVALNTFGRNNGITVQFSEPLDPATALNIANYTLTHPTQNANVIAADFVFDTSTVNLTLDRLPNDPVNYSIQIKNVKDVANTPNVMVTTNISFGTVFADGNINRWEYNNINGTAVANLTGDAKFTGLNPDLKALQSSIDWPQTNPGRDNYGLQYFGYFIPKVTGNYRFAISSDDNSEFYISTDDNPSNKALVAREPNWNNYKIFTGNGGGGGRVINNTNANQSGNIALVANKPYYIQALMKEGGGGDDLAVAVLIPGDTITAFADGMATIPSALLSSVNVALASPITFTTQPANVTVQENKAVTFSVVGAGTGPFTYQWFGSNALSQAFIPLGDGNTATYTPLPQAAFSDNGNKYYVVVRNGFMLATSTVATATVVVDNTPPTITKVVAWYTQTRATVSFSELVDPVSAVNIANYSFTPALTITSATLAGNGTDVILATSAMTPGTTYTLTVNNVNDIASVPNTIVASSTKQFGAWVLSRGFALREWWYNIGGTPLSGLTFAGGYPNFPDFFDYVNSGFQSPQTSPDVNNYGLKLSAQLTVPVSGDYFFYLSSDDASEFYLSDTATADGIYQNPDPSVTPGSRRPSGSPIIRNSAANNNYDSAATGIPLPLTAGASRYIEALLKEGGGGDYVRVAMAIFPDPTGTPVNSTPVIPAAYLSTYADPLGASVTIQTQPAASVSGAEGGTVSLSVNAVGTITGTAANAAPLAYIWQEQLPGTTTWLDLPGKPVNGTNVNSYVVGPLTSAENGGKLRVVVYTLGASATSSSVNLAVVGDTTKPKLVNATANSAGSFITLSFSELIQLSGASVSVSVYNSSPVQNLTVTRYERVNGTNVNVYLSDFTQVQPGVKYSVVINGGITDLASTPNSVDPTTTTKVITGWSFVPGYVQRNVWSNVANGGLSDAINSTNRLPDIVTYETQAEIPVGFADNYTTVLKGWLLPPANGNYLFAISSDDNSALYLAEDADPAHLDTHYIAFEPAWNNNREYETVARRSATAQENVSSNNIVGNTKWQQSDGTYAINLAVGNKYYFEYIQKEGGGGDDGSVTWYIPGTAPTVRVVNGVSSNFYIIAQQPAIQGQYMGVYANPDKTTLAFSVPPANVVTTENSQVTLSATAVGTSFFKTSETVSYQWLSNGIPINGATASTYSFFATLPNGAANVVLPFSVKASMTAPFATNLTSATATVTVNANTTNPTLVSVSSLNSSSIAAIFSRTLLASSANNLANYTLPNGGTVTSAVLQPDGRTVLLGVSGQVNASFGLNVSGVQDTSATTRSVNTNIANIVVNPFSLTDADIGSPGKAGSTLMLTNNVFIMTAGGGDIWNNADQFHMAYVLKTNDFDIKVQITGFQNLNNNNANNMGNNAKAGLMVRESLNANSRELYVTVSPTTRNGGTGAANSIEANKRDATAGGMGNWSNNQGSPAPTVPNQWLRIQRVGNTFTCYRSNDGKAWTLKGADTPSNTTPYPSVVYFGLAGCNNDNGFANIFTFSNLSDVTDKLNVGASGGNIIVTFPATGSAGYKLQGTDSLDGTITWSDIVATSTFTNDGNVTFTVAPAGARKFYRLISR